MAMCCTHGCTYALLVVSQFVLSPSFNEHFTIFIVEIHPEYLGQISAVAISLTNHVFTDNAIPSIYIMVSGARRVKTSGII